MLSTSSQAALLVEQWMGAGNGGLSGVDSAIATRAADYSGSYSIIDFTDDPSGFAGLIPGSVFWPSAGGVNLGTGNALNNDFGARVSTMLTISTADTYHFRTYSDDGVRLRIGGTDVIVDDTYHPEQQRTGSIFLTPGAYPLDLIFFEGGGEASLEFAMAQGAGPYGHVGNFAGTGTSVPEGGSSVALLGLALGAVAGLHKKFAA